MLKDFIGSREKFYIYGAQVVAYGAFTAIRHLWKKTPAAFLVTSEVKNPAVIENIPVALPHDIPLDSPILVAVTELLQKEIADNLRKDGFTNIFLLTAHEEHCLMAEYFQNIGKFPLAENSEAALERDIILYEVRNVRDKPLKGRPDLQSFEHTIQAGAALTDRRIAKLTDNTGDNISDKNKQYCEMTAAYWVWKNTHHKWVGIEHYRRHLLVKPSMLNDEVDVIMPLPYICYPHTINQFSRFVPPEVVEALDTALRCLHPQEYDEYMKILRGKYQYTYNLVCARHEVFDAYCTWFFRITSYMETMGENVPPLVATRALSYVAEVLTNIYFMSRQNELNIKHTEKAIFV